MNDIPIVYAYLYMKIKESNKTEIININPLRERVCRIIHKKSGIPKFLVKDMIEELIEMGLIKRLNFNTYKIIENKCYKKIKQKEFYFG